MIAAQVALVQQRLEELDRLERLEQQIKDITDTRAKLQEVTALVRALLARREAVSDRLPADHAARMRNALLTIAQQVASSRSAYESGSEKRQVNRLTPIINFALPPAQTALKEGWARAAGEQIQPYLDLRVLVEALPEMRARQARLAQLSIELQRARDTVPGSPQAVAAFDSSLAAMREELSAVEGLSDSVTRFLQRALAGTATIADLTDDVLAWCRDVGRASAFAVRLGARRDEAR